MMDYVQILPQLALGSHPQSTDDIERLRTELGVTAVLNLQTDDDMRAVGVNWKPLEAYYGTGSLLLKRVPVRDFDPIDLQKKLPECVRALDRLLVAGHRVYLHCTAGTGRSPTVAIAYLYWCRGWDLEQAAAYVQERHLCFPKLEVIRLAAWDFAK
jgi:hypothetical protein